MPSRVHAPILVAALCACGGERLDPSASPLPAPCQTLADGLWMCASRLQSGAREPLLEALDLQKKGWIERARAGADGAATLERACREALDQVRGSTRELCAGIAWAPAPTASGVPPGPSLGPDAGATPDARGPDSE